MKRLLPKIRFRAYHFFFAISLATLIILGAWWFILHVDQVETIFAQEEEILLLHGHLIAKDLAAMTDRQSPPTLADDSPFVIEKATSDKNEAVPADFSVSLSPTFAGHRLVLKHDTLAERKARIDRRRFMVAGEGALMMLLIFVCVFMLYFLLIVERNRRADLETFFQAMSHELKTPVAGVKALLQTMQKRTMSDEEQARYSQLGLREIARLQSLVENALLANRINRRIFEARAKPLFIREETEEFIERHNKLFPSRPITFEAECAGEFQAMADPDLMRHIMQNLIDNAFKYGGVGTKVQVSLLEAEDWCKIVVEDNGAGFEPRMAKSIFDKFQRIASQATENKEGSGLGLFIAKEAVKAFGGKIEAFSAGENQGARFTIWLKKAEDEA